MNSLFDELSENIRKDPRLARRGGPRADLGLLLFNARDPLRGPWESAERCLVLRDPGAFEALHDAVERLRPIFGERDEQ